MKFSFDNFLELKFKNIKYRQEDKILLLNNYIEPGTITQNEGNWVMNFIIDNNLQCGFEIDRDLNAAINIVALVKAETQPDCLRS